MRGKLFVLALVCALLFSFPARGEGPWRMRVIARGNSRLAQAEKLAVRDCALARAPGASGMTAEAFARMAWAARKRADCRVTLRCYSPDGAIAPAPTVYITIGRGGGHNWWGALYPQAAALTAEETGEREAEVVWPLWDWLRGVLTGWGIMW